MASVGLHLAPVDLVELDRGEVVGVVPVALAYNHLPPHTAVLRGVDPGGVFDLTGLIEVEDEVIREHVARIVADHHCAPWCLTGCLHGSLQTSGIGCQMADEGEGLWQRPWRWLGIGGVGVAATHKLLGEVLGLGIDEFEVHRGVILTGCLVDVDVEAVVALHLQ